MPNHTLNTCVQIWSDPSLHILCGATSADLACIFTLDGTPIGQPISKIINSSCMLSLSTRVPYLYIGDYSKRTVTGIQWDAGTVAWQVGGINHIENLELLNNSMVIVNTWSGNCMQFDAGSGEVGPAMEDVRSVSADSTSQRMVTVRGKKGRGAGHIEFSRGVGITPFATHAFDAGSFVRVAWAPGWVALTENYNGVLYCFDNYGKLMWQYKHETDYLFPCIAASMHGTKVFGIARHHRIRTPIAILLDAATGIIEYASEFAVEHLAYVPVGNGMFIASATGLLRVEDLTWHPRTFIVPDK